MWSVEQALASARPSDRVARYFERDLPSPSREGCAALSSSAPASRTLCRIRHNPAIPLAASPWQGSGDWSESEKVFRTDASDGPPLLHRSTKAAAMVVDNCGHPGPRLAGPLPAAIRGYSSFVKILF